MNATSTLGYWEPHTSSVDFCEPDYLLTSYIAEPHNVWSSAIIVLMAIAGILYGNPTAEWRFTVMYLVLAAIGLGSMMLHTTLHWILQSSDEIPMLWEVQAMVYGVLEMTSPRNKPAYQYLPIFMLLTVITQTAIYYFFQSIYQVFIVSYTVGVGIVVLNIMMYLFDKISPETGAKGTNPKHMAQRWELFWTMVFTYVVVAIPLWLIDMNMCDTLLPVYNKIGGVTLHIVWHVGAAHGGCVLIAFIACVRAQKLGFDTKLRYIAGMLPVVETVPSVADDGNKKKQR